MSDKVIKQRTKVHHMCMSSEKWAFLSIITYRILGNKKEDTKMSWLENKKSHLKCTCIVILLENFNKYALKFANGFAKD